MAIKEKAFILFLVIVIIFPFFFSSKEIKIGKKIDLANMIIADGSFKYYKTLLQKEGTFKKIDFYNQNNYIIEDVYINNIIKNSKLNADKIIFDGLYNLYNIRYKTDKYTYLAKYAIHNENNKTTTAYNFRFFNKKIDGKGEKMVYKNDILLANNIIYTIKGIK